MVEHTIRRRYHTVHEFFTQSHVTDPVRIGDPVFGFREVEKVQGPGYAVLDVDWVLARRFSVYWLTPETVDSNNGFN